MVVTRVGAKLMLVDSGLVRLVEKDKVEIYPNEQMAIKGSEPTKIYEKSEAKKYLNLILSKLNLNGTNEDMTTLFNLAKS